MSDFQGRFDSITQYVEVLKSKSNSVYTFPHIHNYYEVYYNIFGAKGYMVNGIFYKCSERDLILIPRLQAHKVVIDSGCTYYERCIINIDKKLLSVLEIISPAKDSLNWLISENETMSKKTTLSKEEHKVFLKLLNDYKKQSTREEMLGVLAKILAFLRLCFFETHIAEYMKEADISHTDRIMMIIEKDFHNITVSQISEKAHYNSDHLNRIFKSEMGITVKQYLILRKLAEAQKYLCMGKSVKEACSLSGFKDYSNFLRTFKKYFGYTPGKFEEIVNGR